ncbi:MAG: DUF1207 domain-containing protein [bacterium]
MSPRRTIVALLKLSSFILLFVIATGVATANTSPEQDPKRSSKEPVSPGICGQRSCYFPQETLFHPLIGDQTQPRFFASFYDYSSAAKTFNMGSVGYGEDFGFVRWGNTADSGAYQFGLLGGLFAQFNLDAPSNDLINADYTIGFPLEYRYRSFSVRSRIYHQSSHLGDEFLLRADTDRINLSFESLELLGSYELSKWRVYGGGEYLLHRFPRSLDRASLQAGFEYIGGEGIGDVGTLVGGMDYKSFKEHNWSDNYSFKIGVELHRPDGVKRHVRFMLEAYEGHSPFGQFYSNRIEFYGVGLHLGL